MKKRLLFVTSRLPWPPNSGRKVSLYHYCRGLAERYGYEIALFVFPEWDQPRDAAGKPPFIGEVRFAAPIGALTKLVNLATRVAFCRQPLQCALYYSPKNRRLLRQLALEFDPDVILFDMIRVAPYIKDLVGKARCILDLDDLLSLRYERQLAAFDDNTGIAGRYAGGMSRAAERLLCHGVVGRLILKSEQKRLQRAELRYAKTADGVILVAEKETAYLNALLGEPRAVTVPTGVGVYQTDQNRGKEKKPRTFGFIGNLHVAANEASLAHIVRDILPHIPRPFRFEVVGAVPKKLRERYGNAKELSFLGEVAELLPVITAWQICLCPIAFGTGLKTKVLDAMAAELAVVTNTVGADGIVAERGREIFVFDDPVDIAACVGALLADPTRCSEVGKLAQSFVLEHFSWERNFDAFQNLGL